MRPNGTIQLTCPSCGEFTPLTGTFLILDRIDESSGRDICRECGVPFMFGLTINVDRLEKMIYEKELDEVISEMYDEAFDCEQSFDHASAEVLGRYADKLTKILKDNEGDKDE